MSDSIKVAIKVRPLIKREKEENQTIQWLVQENSIYSTDPEIKKRGDGRYHFDHIFDMEVKNPNVFDAIVRPIVDAAVNGFNGTVFAYGQTSSGKTYTMMGTSAEPGIIPLAVECMFNAIANSAGREFLLRVSYLEIYNEKVNDLLSKDRVDLKVHEDTSGQVIVKCKEEITNCPENVMSLMKKGDKNRRTGETNMNERSSRSHTIFRITIESREAGADSDGAIQVSQLNLVDLAGSERARQTGATGERFKEGLHINLSLSTLGLVIMQLSESQNSQKHVNFRDSKLTRLLQASLGGNAMTAIICAVTPAALDETLCTLSFASRAKSVKNKPQVNEVMSDAALLKRYAKQLAKLNAELQKLKHENRAAEVEEMESKLQEKDRINQILEERIELLKTGIVSGDMGNHEGQVKSKDKRRQTWGGPGSFKPLPVFQNKASLPTIKEMSPEKPHRSRKSIIQSVDIMNQTFQTAFADFELELIESERDRGCVDDGSDSEEELFITKRRNGRHVKFTDDVLVAPSNYDSIDTTPEKRNVSIQTLGEQASPSTPKNVLRKSIVELTRDFVELREFTTLEKQLICEEHHCCSHEEEATGPVDPEKQLGSPSPEKNLLEFSSADVLTDANLIELDEAVEKPKFGIKDAKVEDVPGSKEQLRNFGFREEDSLEDVITQLCARLTESEKMQKSEKETNAKAQEKIVDLEKQMKNVTSERDEFQHISTELRVELKKRTAALESRIMELESACDQNLVKENASLKTCNKDLEDFIKNLQCENKQLEDQLAKQPYAIQPELNDSTGDTSKVIICLEEEEHKLAPDPELKIHKVNEIQDDIQALKSHIKEFEQTILLLTNENMEMSTKLSAERQRSKEAEAMLQETITDLYGRISTVTEEKINIEADLKTLKEELESVRSRAQEPNNSEEEQKVWQCKEKIDKLIAENIELSGSITEKNKELERIKESKSLLYDHECTYKENVTKLADDNQSLRSENDKLSTDLMERIEEIETLEKECNDLKSKLDLSLTQNANSLETDVNQLRTENNLLNAEISALKSKIAMLSDENAKLSNNLLETIEDLDNSRNDKSCNNTLHFSGVFDNATEGDKEEEEILHEESREALITKLVASRDKINHLTRLNNKLSDLKLTSCTQCAHLKTMKDGYRTLKLKTKTLSHKLEDLQRKFHRKCTDIEELKNKANQDLNISLSDTVLNSSFLDSMNISYVEEKINLQDDELQKLNEYHEKLLVSYKEKCDELEKLKDDIATGNSVEGDSKSSKRSDDKAARIERVQKVIDQVKDDIHEMKKSSTNFGSIINKFMSEKANLMDEINMLKSMNEQLQQKVSDKELIAATAAEKAQILENEVTHLSKEVGQFEEKKKEIESEKLILEVELEDLKVERETKGALISNLHKTIDELNERLSSIQNELDQMASQKNELATFAESVEQKYKTELEGVKRQYKDLENEKIRNAEAEERAISRAKELQADNEKLQMDLNKHQSTYLDHQQKMSELEKLVNENNIEKGVLEERLEALQAELTDSKNHLETKYKCELESASQKFEEYVKESENELEKVNDVVKQCTEENMKLTLELTRLRNLEEEFLKTKVENESKCSLDGSLSADNERLTEELTAAKECIKRELISLKCKVNSIDFSSKSVTDTFIIFLQALMSKEEEIVKAMRAQFEKDKQKLVDQKRQSEDAEKRANIWAKELEADIEKLQADLTKREGVYDDNQDKISQLEHLLKESNNEKDMLKEKLEALEVEFNNLQTEFERQCKADVKQEEAISVVQKREREVQEALKHKELELQARLTSEKEAYEKKIENLLSTIELHKTKNMDLTNNIDGLEATEKQLKNIIEANAAELKKSDQDIQKLSTELEQLTDAYNEVNREVEMKNSRIEELTVVLKNKCDMLSEYKSKLEILTPDYNLLQEQIRERKINIEKYKEEIETLKMEKQKQIDLIKDKLSSEEIKNTGLNKQLVELNNKNIALVAELDELKEKCEELQQQNIKLERKVRNSTSKIKAEAEMEELKDVNKRLQNNLEGASNRIAELQDSKNQLLKELVDTKGQYDLLSQEHDELKKTISSYKSRQYSPTLTEKEDKYDALLQEKNKIALELEGKKLLLLQKEKDIEKYLKKITELTNKNKELDEELEDYAGVIRERDAENAKLEDKLYTYLTGNKMISDLEDKVKLLKEENDKFQQQLRTFTSKSHLEKKQVQDIKLHNEKLSVELKVLQALRKENSELQAKINELESKLDLRSNSSGSRSASPTFETTRRRHSRNEVFNQRRQLEVVAFDVDTKGNENTCQILRKKIHELELQLVSKNGTIATLEMQIQSENFPYQRKCMDMEEQLLAYRNKNAELNSEVRRLQRSMSDINAWECDTCRRWRVNRRDQSCQTMPNNTIRLCSTNSGIVDEHVRVLKLEKEKALMKELCRSRSRQIKELSERVRELEDAQSTPVLTQIEPSRRSNQQPTHFSYSDRQYDFDKNLRPAMKENIPANTLELTRAANRMKHLWNTNQ